MAKRITIIEIFMRDLLKSKGFDVEWVGYKNNIGYDFIVNGSIKVEFKYSTTKTFTVRRDSGNYKTYAESLDFMVVAQCFNGELRYWIFPSSYSHKGESYPMPRSPKEVSLYLNTFEQLVKK